MKIKDLPVKERKILIRELLLKYEERVRKFERTLWTRTDIYCKQKSFKDLAVRENIILCSRCTGCKRFKRKMYICEELGCGSVHDCLRSSKEKYLKFCKKTRMAPRKKELVKEYKKFFSDYEIYVGLRKTPKRILREMVKNGKIQLQSSSQTSKENRTKKRSKSKGRSKKKNTS